jgi:epoxyqueuosine reductase QueG
MNKDLTELIKGMALDLGASEVGIVTKEMVKDGPDTIDLDYVLNGANSAIVFSVPLDHKYIEPYLSKENRLLNKHKIRKTTFTAGIALEIASFLNQLDYESLPVSPNFVYRKDSPNGMEDRTPPISHIFLAIISGVGFLGHNGLLLTKDDGSAVVLATVVTKAKLIATKPLTPEDSYCDKCNLCSQVCVPSYLNKDNTKLTLNNEEYETREYLDKRRCILVCCGYAGLHPSKKWSTFSPARFEIPINDEDFPETLSKARPAYLGRKRNSGVFYHPLAPNYQLEYACSSCQFIRHPIKKIRNKRYRALVKNGVVIEDENGNRKAVSPEFAEKFIKNMPENRRKLYIDNDFNSIKNKL